MSPDATPRCCFTRDYKLGRAVEVRDLERDVLGCDYGATSWTTRDEVGACGARRHRRRCQAVASDGSALPFADGSFDAIGRSGVLCCMPDKLKLLRECCRVARTGAPMVFSVILPAAALSGAERRLAIESGPEFVDVDGNYSTLLERSDWRVLRRIDVTDVFSQSICTSLPDEHPRRPAG